VPLTEIGDRLHVSVKTVSTYRTRIMGKLEMKSNAELTRYALTEGLID
jgi:DNA-binding NarL/FixJ family response regulator